MYEVKGTDLLLGSRYSVTLEFGIKHIVITADTGRIDASVKTLCGRPGNLSTQLGDNPVPESVMCKQCVACWRKLIDDTKQIKTERLMSMRGWLKNIADRANILRDHPTAADCEELLYQINTNLGKVVNEVERALKPEGYDA